MLKRPINPQFKEAVLAGRKVTTIRATPWPVGKPIMLYEWTGKPYRSKQANVAVVEVMGYWPIVISHEPDGGMIYEVGMIQPLHETEGFDSREAMDAWFRPLVPVGMFVKSYLMRFKVVAVPADSGRTADLGKEEVGND